MADNVLNTLHVYYFVYSSKQLSEIGTIIVPILQMGKLKHGDFNLPNIPQLVNGRAGLQTPGSLTPESAFLASTLSIDIQLVFGKV